MKNEKPSTKVCKQCKTEIPYGAKFCPHCRKKQKAGKGKTIIIILAVIIIIAIIGSSNGGSDDSANNSSAEKGTTTSGGLENQTSSGATSEAASEASTEDNTFHVGDVLETKKVKLSYISCGEYTDDNMFVEPGEGKKFVYFEFEFENASDADITVGSYDFKCYADGYSTTQSLVTADNAMTSITTLSPGRKVSGIIVFEVAEDVSEIEIEYETSYWTQKKAIFVYE